MTPGTEELPTEMGALADRCEQATGPDRELDTAIFAALSVGQAWMHSSPEAERVWSSKYTESLDVAMSLVPNGHQWGVQSFDGAAPAVGWIGKQWIIRNAATPALALCAAALRARAHLQATSDSKEEGR